jgi:hypothetical protein
MCRQGSGSGAGEAKPKMIDTMGDGALRDGAGKRPAERLDAPFGAGPVRGVEGSSICSLPSQGEAP